jgi:hypothetical protein
VSLGSSDRRATGRLATRAIASPAYQRLARGVSRVGWLPTARVYQVTIGRAPRFVWYRVAKAGTRTILGHLEQHADLAVREAYFRHLPVGAYRDHFRFAFVRNPWDRLVSCWANKAVEQNYFALDEETRNSFPAFVRWAAASVDLDTGDIHLRRQSRLIDLERIDFVGRFETFDADLAVVCNRLELPPVARHENRSQHRSFSSYYDEATAALVGQLYERDIRLFGYEPPTDLSVEDADG